VARNRLPADYAGPAMERSIRWLFAWTGVGLLLTFGFFAMFSIGTPFFLAGLFAATMLVRRHHTGSSLFGLLIGAGLICLLIAALNTDYQSCPPGAQSFSVTLKPGQTGAEYQCGGLNPVPLAIVGAAGIAIGLASVAMVRRRGPAELEAMFRSEREATRIDARNPAVKAEERDWEATLGDGVD
jgi:hypothetical protein